MASIHARACLRCHAKKVKCSGYPDCRTCDQAGAKCEQYARAKKSETVEALNNAKQRIKWLEDELLQNFGVDCRCLSIGTSLRPLRSGTTSQADALGPPTLRIDALDSASDAPQVQHVATHQSSDADNAPEAGLLALNATGETRYLGPSSGAFFATYAAAVARSLLPGQRPVKTRLLGLASGDQFDVAPSQLSTDENIILSEDEAMMLLESYRMWVHPQFPLLGPKTLEDLVERCCKIQNVDAGDHVENMERNGALTIFYLVMALGATNYVNTLRHIRSDLPSGHIQDRLGRSASSQYFYLMALRYFDLNAQGMRTSITAVQVVLLISIYTSYGSIGSSQWQLAGLAMRMAVELGLHYAPKHSQSSKVEVDRKSRVFWTAYAIEMSLAYNLGRPPSIGDEHITIQLPLATEETMLGIHHIKHRRIQSRLVSQVYCGASKASVMSGEERQNIITKLQGELDDWMAATDKIYRTREGGPYPPSYWKRLYYGTSFVLHRSSPLCPQPSSQSLEQCIRSAGTYIDCMTDVLRTSNVPLTWMLVQGVLFAGLTMLVTSRTGFHRITQHTGLSFLLVDLPAWARKCSICLAIINERWSEDLLPHLDAQFETLANDTLKLISEGIMAQAKDKNTARTSAPNKHAVEIRERTETSQLEPDPIPQEGAAMMYNVAGPGGPMMEDWQYLDSFRDFLGIDGTQTFWDILSPGAAQDNFQLTPLGEQNI